MKRPAKKNAFVLLCGGSGSRMGESIEDKLLLQLGPLPVVAWSIRAFIESASFAAGVIVFRTDRQRDEIAKAIAPLAPFPFNLSYIAGGGERADSVREGLLSLPRDTAIVAIHDAARPLIDPKTIGQAVQICQNEGPTVLAHRITDTIKRTPEPNSDQPMLLEDLQRDRLWAMETPQFFPYPLILEAYRQTPKDSSPLTDDTSTLQALDHPVKIFPNPHPNPKLTHPQDLAWLNFLIQNPPPKNLPSMPSID